MTLIVAIKYLNGVVMACDSRATIGEAMMRNDERKIEIIGNNVAIMSAGLAGGISKILDELKLWFESTKSPTLKDIVEKCEDISWAFSQKYKKRLEDSEELPVLVLATHSKIFRIFNGFSEEGGNYECEGSGTPFGEYIIGQNFKAEMSEINAKELAVYTILQTQRMDPNVGGKINMVVLHPTHAEMINDKELDKIAEGAKVTVDIREIETQKLIVDIVDKRRWINARFNEKFGFGLFEQNEIAILEIQKKCNDETEFTNRIAALALLIDGMAVSGMNKLMSTHPTGSINVLETFLKEKYQNLDSKIVDNLREIMILRSKKMPIHEDDPKIVQVLLKWENKIPPDWCLLWTQALAKYKESLEGLGQLLSSK